MYRVNLTYLIDVTSSKGLYCVHYKFGECETANTASLWCSAQTPHNYLILTSGLLCVIPIHRFQHPSRTQPHHSKNVINLQASFPYIVLHVKIGFRSGRNFLLGSALLLVFLWCVEFSRARRSVENDMEHHIICSHISQRKHRLASLGEDSFDNKVFMPLSSPSSLPVAEKDGNGNRESIVPEYNITFFSLYTFSFLDNLISYGASTTTSATDNINIEDIPHEIV